MREHQSMVFSIARRIVHDPSLAEEVAQDVFHELYGTLPSLASEEHVVHWLRRVTVHRSIDQARRMLRRPQDHTAVSFAEPGVDEPAAALRETDPWVAERLRQMVASLPVVARTVIVLRYQEELMPEEIAALLEMPVATVKSHLQRALKVLRARMQRKTQYKMLRASSSRSGCATGRSGRATER
jgi:RNA polymerase sigma-70 factor (ECF subfamily)